MAKEPPLSGLNTTDDHLQTWILRVYIHCEGCKKKVFKVLHSIDGVYKVVIDAKQHKATVTGSVDGQTLVQKLLKSGKHAEILPESFTATAADNSFENLGKKKEQISKENNDVPKAADDAEHAKGATTGLKDQEIADPPSGKKKKRKKKKVDKNDNNAQPNGETEPGVVVENVGASMEQLNLGPPMPQMVYTTPYDLPPYHNYYPAPAYGVSYSTSFPSAESSYYTPPVYGYAQSHPAVFYPVPPHSSGYRGSAFDDHDDDGGYGRVCTIM